MGFHRFTTNEYSDLEKQHNILAIVGNGFDIQAARAFGRETDTRYENFYDFLKRRSFDPGNLILQEMESARTRGLEDWSDLEAAISARLDREPSRSSHLTGALRALQLEFSHFLAEVAEPDLLHALGQAAMENKWGVRSLSKFAGDVPVGAGLPEFQFPARTKYYDLLNFVFVNLNYTPLLDGYVFLDQGQFDPHPHKWADRNFQFYPSPNRFREGVGNEQTSWSSYVLTEVVHPHGYQGVPRSLLFGVDSAGASRRARDARRDLEKPFWAQSEIRYSHLIMDADLFIVFGASLGVTDRWWWGQMARSLEASEQSELIIYQYQPKGGDFNPSSVRRRFFDSAGVDAECARRIETRIHVVFHSEACPQVWLGMHT